MTHSTNFIAGTTVTKEWLNDVDAFVFEYTINAKLYGLVGDGITDDTAALQALITAAPSGSNIVFPPGTYIVSSSISITSKTGLKLSGTKNSIIKFTDGAYVGFSITGASYNIVFSNLSIYGNNTSSPAITLIKFTGDSAYPIVEGCSFSYASKAIYLGKTYVVKLIGNNYANCDTYVYATVSEGPTADAALIGETFGTSLIGSSALIDLQFVFARLVGCYFEVQNKAKLSVITRDIPGNPELQYSLTGCQFFDSGGVKVTGQSNLVMSGCTAERSYTIGEDCFLRVDANATAAVSGNIIANSSVVAGIFGISSSGITTATGNTIRNWDKGTAIGQGVVDCNTFLGCTTGVYVGVGSITAVGDNNCFSSTTTNITNSSGGTALAPSNFTGTLTGVTTSVTGLVRYEVTNGVATLTIPALSGTSNTTACTITGLHAACTPPITVFGNVVLVLDNGVQSTEQVSISSSGVITLYKNGNSSGFTSSGTKGIRECVVTYRMRNV